MDDIAMHNSQVEHLHHVLPLMKAAALPVLAVASVQP